MKSNFFNPNLLRSVVAIAAIALCTNAQAQWTTVDTEGFRPGGDYYQHMFFDAANTPYVSFSGNYGEVMKFDGTHWIFVGGADITPGPASESSSAIAPNGNIYFSYSNMVDSSKVEVMMYNGSTWNALGTALSADTAFSTNVAISASGIPYVSFIDKIGARKRLYVKKYVAGSWVAVGSAIADTTLINFPSLTIDHNDSVYIAYEDEANTKKVIVKKFNGSNWVMLDTPFSAQPSGENAYVSLAIDDANVPYVSYLNGYPAGNSVSVSKYVGTHFVTVGSAAFTPSGSGFAALAIDHNNLPYVVYSDNTIGGLASVMKFDGTAWNSLGAAGFSSYTAIYNTIAIDANNNPYVAFLDVMNGGTTVMKFPVCTPPSATAATASSTFICNGTADTIMVTGNLNDATQWYWHTGSCTGTAIDSGTTITITPNDTTTYYVSGHGGCVRSSECVPITINVDGTTPTISVSGLVLSSSSATGYQWYIGGSAITAATSSTYTATTTGWYQVMATNSNGCSTISDSVFVNIAAGIAGIDKKPTANIYPSPATDIINIDFSNYQNNGQGATLTILDNVGRQVLVKDNLNQSNTISLTTLPSGVYFINLVTPSDKQVAKIIKQ